MSTANPRQLAFSILCRVDEGAYADLTLDAELARAGRIDPRDRGLVTELVYGVLRQRGRLDFALTKFCSKPLAKVEPRVLTLLRLGAYQLLMLDRVPAPAAVHETVELARQENLERATGFINGILRSIIRQQQEIAWPDPADAVPYLEKLMAFPHWLAKSWVRQFGAQEAVVIGEALLQPAPFTVRVNTLKISREAFLEALAQNGFEARPTAYAPEGVVITARSGGPIPGDAEGWYQVQDEASMLIAHLLGARPQERILDACSAPGGKTTHVCALGENAVAVLALDLHPQRVRLVESGARRLGCLGIETRAWDLTRVPDFLSPQSFDRVLVDAPCSGLGVLRRNPEIRWRRTAKDVALMAEQQRFILANAAALVKPGGRLLYSLCTLTAEETAGVVQAFLAAHPEFEQEDLRGAAPAHWQELFADDGCLHTWPHRHDGMDAFFATAFRRLKG
ncbi:16S rRNA (cytosine(967)-C(5))-methyltransferase RsmB [Trichloromonas sp.]|uniref:16S rRNA (cytosine(967)-C(5))-methyltransferase RsmB n=1 Tax=Trichloromonas sp. TaxID=3069249 RepID=UPI003D81AB11